MFRDVRHPLADIQSPDIGEGTNVWQFCIILPKAKIGRDCNICANVFIENDVKIGDRVTIKCGVQLYDGIRVGNDVFIGPNVTFCNDKYPKSGNRSFHCLPVIIEDNVSIGGNATILPDITLGKGCIVGAGAVVTKNVAPGAVVVGNPAKEMK